MEVRNLQFGLQVDLILDVGPDVFLGRLTVLAEEDEDRVEDGFQADREGEQSEWKRIELWNSWDLDGVHQKPRSKLGDMDHQERNAAGELGDPVGSFLDHGPMILHLLVDIPGCGVAQPLSADA